MLSQAPAGFLVDSRWLTKHGVSRQLSHHYAERGWLERVAHGLFRVPLAQSVAAQTTSDWTVPLLSAQWLGYDIHIGGPTALALHGHVHYLPLGGKEVAYLYSDDPPTWLKRLNLRSEMRLRTKRLFDDPVLGLEQITATSQDGDLLSPWAWPVTTSTPERAILECLDELPENEGFGSVDAAFEGLTSLRPALLTSLLQSCRSVQVNRLFFVYADKHAHAWRKYVEPSQFDLGSGDRSFAEGGRLHPRYRITVPAELMPRPEVDADGA